jgi:two-component system, cell cycle sensor histidine kinase and response regulator CckA
MNNLPAEKNRRILIIDDNRAIHDDFRKILSPGTITAAALNVTEMELFGKPTNVIRKIQYEIDSAYQGQEGMLLVQKALAEERPYALAFVDIRMPPGWDGVETTQMIWAVDPDVQIVLCTAYADYSWDEMFEKIGNHDGLVILKKPFDTVEALQLAHAFTEKWWLHRQSRRKMEELEKIVAERTSELQWKTAFLEAQVNSSIDGILVVDREGKKSIQNQRVADLFKIPPAIADGNDDAAQVRWVTDMIITPEQFVEKVLYLYARPDEISRDEIELKDGTILDRYSAPVIGKDGKNYGRIWTFRDITERKQTEEALSRERNLLRMMFDLLPDYIYLKDVQSRFVVCNNRRADNDAMPVTTNDLIGKTDADFFPPEQAARFRADELVVLGGTPMIDKEETLIRPDGSQQVVLTTKLPFRDSSGKIVGLLGYGRDITERKRTEESLRLLVSAVEQSKESVVITDAELALPGPKIIFVNPAFTQMTGYSEEEVMGKTPRILQGPRTDKTVLSRLRQNLERGKVFQGEAINYRKDGTEFDMEWQIAPLRNVSGKITHFVAIQHDITERKQLEAQLFQSQKLETVGKLAGGIAHEFNSILTAIIGQSELLLGELPAGSPLAKNATEISKAAGRAATLTRQLLAYGRKQFLQPEALDLNRVVASMEGMFHHLMGGDVDTHIVPAIDLQAVKADAGQIEQVIVNMAINARDAMSNGGKLTLETANVSFDQESVGRYPELKPGDYVMLAITDTGTGMSEEVRARVFEPFFSTKGVGQGTGLGLSTCYGIIKQSGGHISVYSEPGRGTTFKIYLPQMEQQVKISIQRLDSPELPHGTETILLVEDDPALREMAATLLRRLGYTVLTAANGVEALSLNHQRDSGEIDLLFTDVVMPHMSGKELADRVRTLYPHTRILFTSAYTENAIVHQGVLNKGVALLQKPFTPSALAYKVREMLDQPGAPRPDDAQETFGFTKNSDKVKTLGN